MSGLNKTGIEVMVKDQYGKRVFYPNCINSKVFAAIAGTTTLTERTLRQIKQLGYEIKFTTEPINLKDIEL